LQDGAAAVVAKPDVVNLDQRIGVQMVVRQTDATGSKRKPNADKPVDDGNKLSHAALKAQG
jgi:hypothetical protein